ncbi:MAG: helix-hairpin-helix domain-containing protein [Defluviitaleaceae bacterium]|nr:helix-hairpin-helix domain-containing protein [Defluviitaleaceae bacterium]
MIKKLHKSLAGFFAVLMLVGALMPVAVFGQSFTPNFVELPTSTSGRVIDIIDVDSIIVQTPYGEALVRLIGVAPNNTGNSIEFLSNQIMGQMVGLSADPNVSSFGRWNLRYVFLQSRNINIELVLSGYAQTNENHSHASLFSQFQAAQSVSQLAGLGDWANDLRRPHIIRSADRININTATNAQMVQQLGITTAVAQNIVTHRNSAVFQTLADISFVTNFTREMYSQNRHRMGVNTNINTAVELELLSLGMTQAQARSVIASRVDNGTFTNIQQLRDRNLISQALFNNIQHFIAVDDVYEVDFSRPNFRANINTASQAQLTRAGATAAQANAIIQQRNIMPLRNTGDLLAHTSFAIANINALSDNMRALTNINTAPRSEIESLFGRFNMTAAQINTTTNNIMNHRDNVSNFGNIQQLIPHLPTNFALSNIEPFIYVGEMPATPVRINVNRATVNQLVSVGVPQATAQQIVNHNGRNNGWLLPTNLPVIIQNLPFVVRNNLTLRTNINTATSEELSALDSNMSNEIIQRIIAYREDQPFGNVLQLRDLLDTFNQRALYNRIERFLIVR